MAHRGRLRLATGAAVVLVILTAGIAAAGNYAEVGVTTGMDDPPTAGEEREIRFTLFQHGVTPVDFGMVQLIATLPGTGESLTVEAASLGDGAWAASVAFPSAGDWQVRIVHSVFETPDAFGVAVAEPGLAWASTVIPIVAVALVSLALVAGALLLGRRATPIARPEPEPSPNRT